MLYKGGLITPDPVPLMESDGPMPQFHSTRRQFLQGSLGAGAALLTGSRLIRADSPNQKLNVAFIGVGGRGA